LSRGGIECGAVRSWHTNTPRAAGKTQERLGSLHEVVAVNDVGRARLIEARDHIDAAGFQFIGQRSPSRGVHGHVVAARVQSKSQIACDDLRSGASRECDVGE
jgi:hypothetical protein